jgi:diguanylate cyclase (GGDEF)-like protein
LDADSLPALVRLRGLLEVTKLVRSDEDLERLLGAIARTIAESLGFGTVVVNLYRPAWDDFKVSTVHGGDAARETLIGDARGWDVWAPLLNQRFNRRGAYFIPHGSFDWETFAPNAYRPPIVESGEPGAWHPDDALFVPLRHSDGHLLGVLAVDEPASGRVPTEDDLDVLVALGAHAALALQSAQEAADLARHRTQLEQLLQVSSQLTETFSIKSILQSVCDGISAALGFQNTSIDLDDPATGGLKARASHGWNLDQPSVSSVMSVAELQTMMEPQWEVEGCFLVPAAEAQARLHDEHLHYQSVMNGAGPRAWNDHWLFVPLYTRSGELTGVIWADDPSDRLLPSATTLQALRMFANQATTALDSAAQFEEMRFLADHDPLTRLFNRRAFNTALNAEAARYHRYGRSYALIVGDLDGFKSLNDTRGHLSGDEALQAFAAILTEGRREVDAVFRIGGDEFALLLPEVTRKEADAVAERIQQAIAVSADPRLEGLVASFGIAVCPADGTEAGVLFQAADASMYVAKGDAR